MFEEDARSISRLAGLGAFTAAWVGAATMHQAFVAPSERDAVFQRYLRRWADSLVSQTGGQVILTPESRVPPQNGPRLIVSNHRSPFDIGVLLSIFGGHAVSRADIARWPVIGYAARRAGTIFVDRDSAGSGASAIRAIRRKLQEGASILVFPEGGTFYGDEVRPFRAGAFSALKGLNAEVVPVGLAYDHGSEYVDETFVEHVLRVARRRQTRCVVHIGTPRMAQGRAQELSASLHQEVQSLVTRARGHWESLPTPAK
ncbi:MAG: lysophospholipid acyltransferase family protein [Myxococcales bacterium]